MHETEITKHLIDHTLAGEPELTASFVREVCGVETASTWFECAREVEIRDDRAPRGIVVGIAPLPGVGTGDQRLLGSRPDGLIATADLLVLLEFKRVGRLEHFQLVRHATEWAFDIPMDLGFEPTPPGFALRTWHTVGGWVARARMVAYPTRTIRRVAEFAALVEREDLAHLDPTSLSPMQPMS